MAVEPMWRIDMTFEEQAPPGQDTTYVRARLASEAITAAKRVHQHEYGGMKSAVAKKVKGQPDPPEPTPPPPPLPAAEDPDDEEEFF